MSSSYENAVDSFLWLLGQSRVGNLDKIWKVFMAYSLCLVVQALARNHYNIIPMNHTAGFRFKCFPQGNPDDYSYFRAVKGNEALEVRLSIDSQNVSFFSMKLNLDVVIIHENSINSDNLVDSGNDLIAFMECKNYRGFPELVAGFQGMIYELQIGRLRRGSRTSFRVPACLLLSQSGNSILFMDRRYQKYNKSMRIFDMLQPGNVNTQNFVQTLI